MIKAENNPETAIKILEETAYNSIYIIMLSFFGVLWLNKAFCSIRFSISYATLIFITFYYDGHCICMIWWAIN